MRNPLCSIRPPPAMATCAARPFQFGKLSVRFGKGSRRRGPKQRLIPLINGADVLLRWFVQDVWGQLDHAGANQPASRSPSDKCVDAVRIATGTLGGTKRVKATIAANRPRPAAGRPPVLEEKQVR